MKVAVEDIHVVFISVVCLKLYVMKVAVEDIHVEVYVKGYLVLIAHGLLPTV